MLKKSLSAVPFVLGAVVPGYAGEDVLSDNAKKPVEIAPTVAAQSESTARPEGYAEDMIEPMLRAAMKKAIAEYHGWDSYDVSEK